MKKSNVEDVDTYIANSVLEARPILMELREIIKSTIPAVEESISWSVPFYRYHGALAGFATYKNHISFGLSEELQSEDREMLEKQGYTTGKKTIQINFNQKVPAELKRILKAKAKLNEAKGKIK